MNPLIVAPLIMAFICLYAGIYHFSMFIRQRDDKLSLAFSLLCFSVALYDFCSFGLYSSKSINFGVLYQNLQLTVVNLISVSMPLVYILSNQYAPKKGDIGFIIYIRGFFYL